MKEKLQKIKWLLSEGKKDLSWMLANHDNCDGFPMAHCDVAHDNVEESLALIDSILAEMDSPELVEKVAKDIRELMCYNSDHEGKGIDVNFPLNQDRFEITYCSPLELAQAAIEAITV